ncbi:MAG: hypothetical protein ACKVPJ_13280 [Chitinophagales bacterium]
MAEINAENRKKDHIELALQSQLREASNDKRFYYEPVLSSHGKPFPQAKNFLGKHLRLPVWISSMTGGTELAGKINKNLARACNEFGMGMGLGSCRSLLESDKHFEDFNLRPIIGNELPFFANLGIAQVEKILVENNISAIQRMIEKLQADGLIIHINPLQEFLQPEGDRFQHAPIETIKKILGLVSFPIIVKEVGQGLGPESVRALLQLPIAALDFGAYGGTNFSKVELLRSSETRTSAFESLSYIGHTAAEMTDFVLQLTYNGGENIHCREIIVSGGVKSFLDGYYFTKQIENNSEANMKAIYGQGSSFLKYAQNNYTELKTYIESQREGLALCEAYLKCR